MVFFLKKIIILLEPLLCFPAHDAAISSINWIVFEGGLESYIISSGFDGKVMLHDLQDPYDPTLLVRVRGRLTNVLIHFVFFLYIIKKVTLITAFFN